MYNNPYQDEPISVQPTEPYPQYPPMEELQPRPAPPPAQPTPILNESVVPTRDDADSVEAAQEEARTIKFAIGKLNDYLHWFLVVLQVMLLIRFIFKLIGADPSNPFASFLYALTQIIVLPFYTIVPATTFGGYRAFEWSTLIAMAIYYLIFCAVRKFLYILISGPEEPVE